MLERLVVLTVLPKLTTLTEGSHGLCVGPVATPAQPATAGAGGFRGRCDGPSWNRKLELRVEDLSGERGVLFLKEGDKQIPGDPLPPHLEGRPWQ